MANFPDLKDELATLWFGDAWGEQAGKLAANKQANDEKRLGSLLGYKAGLSPEQAKREASKRVRRLRARQLERWIEMMGETCHRCQRKFNQTDSRAQRCTGKDCREA